MASTTNPIPKDYDELHKNFMPFIAGEVRKLNTVTHNLEDLLQDVFAHLIHSKVIERFWEYADNAKAVPETMTVVEACSFLGISLKQWSARNWIVRKGYKDRKSGKIRRVSYTLPEPLSGGYSSPDAIYSGADIVNVAADESIKWQNQGPITLPSAKAPSSYMFMNYLGRAVLNHFNNFCRTRSRKWKDRTGDTLHTTPQTRLRGPDGKPIKADDRTDETTQYTAFPRSRLGNSAPQFHMEDGSYNTHWEDSICDDVAETRIEAQVALSQALDQLEKRGVNHQERQEICTNIQDGYTLVEAIKRTNMGTARKRAISKVFEG